MRFISLTDLPKTERRRDISQRRAV